MSKIGKVEWLFLYIVTGLIDVIQFIIDLFVIGVAINEIADPIIGVCLAGYFQIRGVSMIKHPTRLLSLIGVAGLDAITGGIAPAWIVDVWYIHSTVRKEEAQKMMAQEQENLLQNVTTRPLNENGVRQPSIEQVEQAPLNIDGIRPPNGGLNR